MSDLLPPSATPQERAISLAIERAAAVPMNAKSVWNPDTCPADLLPWLAWAFSVDDWNPDWTEVQKRAAIKSAYYVATRKGTIGAMQTALESLGFVFRVVEWFQETPAAAPYTFRVDVDVVDVVNTADIQTEVERIVDSTKNLRSHATSIVAATASIARAYTGGVPQIGSAITTYSA